MIIVGSSAAKYWWEDWREPSDMDVWSYSGVDPALWGVRVDAHHLPKSILMLIPVERDYATPDALYTIKLSHLGWDNHAWEKHKQDALVMQHKGCKLIPELFVALVGHWKKELGNKDFLSLSQNKEDFFTDNVDYEFDHDWLHEVVSYPNSPVYTEVLVDGQDILVCKEKFNNLPFTKQVKMFREEMSVIALERWVLPSRGKVSWIQAYQWAVRKTITSLTKGWATEFIVKNLEYFVKPDYSYFKNALEEFNMTSKVDLAPFEKALELGLQGECGSTLTELVYSMCESELALSDEVLSGIWPTSNGRSWDDPEYKQERETYQNTYKEKMDSILNSLGGFERLQQEGGGEGGSEYCYGVFRLGDKIYSASYSYYSHHGHEYDYILETLKEVSPKQKTITIYE